MRYWLQAIAAIYVHDSEHADDKPASAGTTIVTYNSLVDLDRCAGSRQAKQA